MPSLLHDSSLCDLNVLIVPIFTALSGRLFQVSTTLAEGILADI